MHHQTSDTSFEPITDGHSGLLRLPENDSETIVVNGWKHFFWEFAPGSSVPFVASPSERYYRAWRG